MISFLAKTLHFGSVTLCYSFLFYSYTIMLYIIFKCYPSAPGFSSYHCTLAKVVLFILKSSVIPQVLMTYSPHFPKLLHQMFNYVFSISDWVPRCPPKSTYLKLKPLPYHQHTNTCTNTHLLIVISNLYSQRKKWTSIVVHIKLLAAIHHTVNNHIFPTLPFPVCS